MSTSGVLLFTYLKWAATVKKFESFLAKRVEARYRNGYIYYCANGTLAADNGAFIFIEESFVQDNKKKMLCIEIPYECILSVVELPPESAPQG